LPRSSVSNGLRRSHRRRHVGSLAKTGGIAHLRPRRPCSSRPRCNPRRG
jgi:hypothetical protein